MAKGKVKRIQMDNVGRVAEVKARVKGLEAEEIKRNPKYKVPTREISNKR